MDFAEMEKEFLSLRSKYRRELITRIKQSFDEVKESGIDVSIFLFTTTTTSDYYFMKTYLEFEDEEIYIVGYCNGDMCDKVKIEFNKELITQIEECGIDDIISIYNNFSDIIDEAI